MFFEKSEEGHEKGLGVIDMSSILFRLIDKINFQNGLFTKSIDASASDSSIGTEA